LTDASLHPLSGNLPAWPRLVPASPGDYRLQVDMGAHGLQTALVHVTSLGPYKLLVGRDNRLFAPLEQRFWYGLLGALAVLVIAGLLIGLITRRALMTRVDKLCPRSSTVI
jgi:hypothetical protein